MDNLAEVSALEHCAICNQVFQGKDEFEKHQSVVHREGYYPCDMCSKRYCQRYNLRTHIKVDHKPAKEKLECPNCRKLFGVGSRLLSHIERKHKEKSLLCDICEQKFSCKTSLTRHQDRKHIRSRNFPCSQCEKKFHDEYDVRTHSSQVHSKLEPYQCDMCPSKFKRNSGWRSRRKIHLDSKNFQCTVCLKKFKNRTSAAICLRRHNILEYPCTVDNCVTVLQTENGRQKHMKQHRERNRPTCAICTRTLSCRSDLNRHMKNVHGNVEKNFACTVCGLKKATIHELERHMRTHSGQIFSCSFDGCTSKSNTQYGLNFHFKKKHGQVNHRRSVEEIERDQNKRFTCEICDKSFKLGKAPLFVMNAHRKSHKNQESLDCLVKDCTRKIFPKKNMTSDKSCNLPIELYTHLESAHAISFDQYHIQATFTCYLCDKELTLQSVKQATPAKIGCRRAPPSNWGVNLKTHMIKFHEESIKAVEKNMKLSNYFVRKHLFLEKVPPLSFIDQLVAEKVCKLNCDFEVRDERFPSAVKKKLLRHYSIEHFGSALLELESKYFKGQRFPICTLCNFEIKRPVENLNTKATHIGVDHKEIIPILAFHFSNEDPLPLKISSENCTEETKETLASKTGTNEIIEELVQSMNFEIEREIFKT